MAYLDAPFADLFGLFLGVWPLQCRPESPSDAIVVSSAILTTSTICVQTYKRPMTESTSESYLLPAWSQKMPLSLPLVQP